MKTSTFFVFPVTIVAAAALLTGCVGAETEDDMSYEDEPEARVESEAEGTAALASSCSGTLIEHIPLKNGTATYGYLDVYYNGSTGKNCAMTRAAGSAYGNATRISVVLIRCQQTTSGSNCTYDPAAGDRVVDDGAYHYYAGPVELSAAGRCIWAAGDLWYNGVKVHAQTSPLASHCG
jgi:hypothetical protein